MFCEVIVGVPALYNKPLTYRGEADVGSLVTVPLGSRQVAALVLAKHNTVELVSSDLKEIGNRLYSGHVWLDNNLLNLAQNMADFYLSSLGAALEIMLPVPFAPKEVAGLKRVIVDKPTSSSGSLLRRKPTTLTLEQQQAISSIVEAIDLRESTPHLVHGVTGSGKTEVYLHVIEHVLERNMQALYLVPEIALTPQVVAILASRFGDALGVLHSGLSPGLKARTWRRIQSGEVKIVVGARSAVFAPVQNLGVIVLDEEHETSYRHEGGLNFHARIVAQMRIKQQGGLVVLGSATPSLDVYCSAARGRTKLVKMMTRPSGSELPEVEIVDLREQLRLGHNGLISMPLRHALAEGLARGEQGLLLFNRRGYAQFALCQDCGHIPLCPHCDVSLHYHASTRSLKCHYCGYGELLKTSCSKCGSTTIRKRGAGTEKLEEELKEIFPNHTTTRIDADTTTRKGAHEKLLSEFGSNDSQILIGTRMIAKGLDFPNVTVVGVIDADSGLYFADFRAVEESFHLLTQVAGRSGRGKLKGKVYVQTYNPEHYCLRLAARQDYQAFYSVESKLRKKLSYPPFGGLVTLYFKGSDKKRVIAAAEAVARCFPTDGITLLGPVASIPEKINNVYRYQLSIKGPSRGYLQKLISSQQKCVNELCNGINWYVVID